MSKKQLLGLCACNAVIFAGISAFVSLMPIYLTQLGADSSTTGFFLAFGYGTLAIGTVAGGRLSDWLQRRKGLLIVSGALAVPITAIAGQVTALVPLMILMGGLWFLTGVIMTTVNILAGLFSEPGERGRLFGIINLSLGLGIALGAAISGPVVDHFGFPPLFAVMAVLYLVIPVVATVFVQDKIVARPEARAGSSGLGGAFSNRTFLFLFLASVIGQAANGFIFLSRATLMNQLHFDATAIASTGAVGSLVTLPLPLVIGYLADRVGRRALIFACLLTTTLGLIVLLFATEWWQFCLATILQSILAMSLVVGSALVTDTFPEASLGTPMALLSATPFLGIVLGLSAGGVVISSLPMQPALLLGIGVSVISLLLVLPMSAQNAVRRADSISAAAD